MRFNTPARDLEFSIPDEWWSFAEMKTFDPGAGGYYPYTLNAKNVEVIDLTEIRPPRRDDGVPPFQKYKLVPVLLAFQSPECELPAVDVRRIETGGYRYEVLNGYHRYYASIAVGFTKLPVVVRSQ